MKTSKPLSQTKISSNLMPHYNRILNSGIQIMISDIDYDRASEILELNIKQKTYLSKLPIGKHQIQLGKE